MSENKYNHRRPLEDFQEELEIIRKAGFNPIGVSQIYLEDTFIFNNKKDAHKAYKLLEDKDNSEVVGWWYSKRDFLKEAEKYEKEFKTKVRVHWLK